MRKRSTEITIFSIVIKVFIIFVFLFIFSIVFAKPGFSFFKSYEEYKMEIRQLGNSGQYNKAIEVTEEMLTYYPEKRTMWLPILSDYYTQLRDLKSAAEALEKYLESYPDDYDWKRILAMNYIEQGLHDKSIPLIEECLEYNPNDVVIRIEYSKVLTEKGLHKEAENQCRIYIKSRPDDYKGWWMLGNIMSNKGNKAVAIIYWLKVPMFRIRYLLFLVISILFCAGIVTYFWLLERNYKKEEISDIKKGKIWIVGIWLFGILFLSAAVYNFYHPLLAGYWFTYPPWFAQYVFPLFLLLISIGLLMKFKLVRIIAILFALSKVLEQIYNLSFSYGDVSKISLSLAVMLSWLIPILYLGIPKVKEHFK